MMAQLRRVADPGSAEGERWASLRMHLIASPMMIELGYSSKLNAEWPFLEMLRAEGRRAAEEFLATKGENLGRKPSIDIDVLLEGV
jgi:NTE family protein